MRGLLQGGEDCAENAVQISDYIIVPEADHAIAKDIQLGRPARIVLCALVSMLAAVEFHDQHRLLADEVRDKGIDRHLPSELPAIETSVTKISPQPPLDIGLVAAETAGDLGFRASQGSKTLTPTLSRLREREATAS